MRWADERYVRVYTRDTADWNMLPWQGRALFPLLLRKVDRAGLLDMGKHGFRGLATQVGLPVEVVEVGFEGLLIDGCIVKNGSVVVVRNFIEAQETPSSDTRRKRDQRERARAVVRDSAGHRVTPRDLAGQPVTSRDQKSRNVTESHETGTESHEVSREVTGGHEVSLCAVPCCTPEEAIPDSQAHRVESEPVPKFDFVEVYRLYPRKEGKKKGLAACKQQVKTQEKYETLLVAVKRYATAVANREKQHIKHFDKWMACWEDYLPDGDLLSPTIPGEHGKTQEEIDNDYVSSGVPCVLLAERAVANPSSVKNGHG